MSHPLPWQSTFLSDLSPDFVNPIAPKRGDSVRVRARVRTADRPQLVHIRYIHDGGSVRTPMHSSQEGAFTWYQASLPADAAGLLQWHFIVYDDAGAHFVTRNGTTSYPPTEDHDFAIVVDAAVPTWPGRSVCYQIFPDRFCNADHASDRSSDDYEFDGARPIAMQWDQAPLEYAEGRCMDFFNGDLDGVAAKADYLHELGVGCVYLTPIFAARTTHRYDCIDYFRVDDALGGNQALERMTAALHERGIRVVVDVSINHTGIDHAWFRAAKEGKPEAARYYRGDDGDFAYWAGVPTLPQLNYGDATLRNVIWEGNDSLVRRWLRPPYRIDGWRFDVAHETGRRGRDQFGHEIWRGVRAAVKSENPEAYVVAEHWEDNISYQLGDQWDGAMNYFGCGDPLRRWLGETTRFDDPQLGGHRPGSRDQLYGRGTTGGELAAMITQHVSRLPWPHSNVQLNVLDTHDIHRVHNNPQVFSPDRYEGAVALQFLLPGMPNIWYGDEVGLAGHIDTVEGCRYPMEWDPDVWDRRMLDLYRRLAQLKRDEPVLHDGALRLLDAGDDWMVAARYRIGTPSRIVVLILNKRAAPATQAVDLTAFGTPQAARELLRDDAVSIDAAQLRVELAADCSALVIADLADG